MRTIDEIKLFCITSAEAGISSSKIRLTKGEKLLLFNNLGCKTLTEAVILLKYCKSVECPECEDCSKTPPTFVKLQDYTVGTPYQENIFVRYMHKTGEINPVEVAYILRSKSYLTNEIFSIFDWEIITQKTWVNSRVNFILNDFKILPGDTIAVSGENISIVNTYGVIGSKQLLFEQDNSKIRKIGSGAFSVQLLPSNKNIFEINIPVFYDESVYGIIDNSNVLSGNGIRNTAILFDNIPDSFECYFKLIINGDPKRAIYPEQTSILKTRFYFLKDSWPLLDMTYFPEVSDAYNYIVVSASFNKEKDFIYVKFYKESVTDKVKMQIFEINEIPVGV